MNNNNYFFNIEMKSVLALSALVASTYAGYADDWLAAAVTFDEGYEPDWE